MSEKNNIMEKLHGVIVPAVTPFCENGEIDFQGLEYNYKKWNTTKVKGYMCLGSNGEFRSLDDDESLAVIRTASECKAEDKTLIVGIGRESLYRTLAFIDRLAAENLQIDFVSVLTPCYFAKLMTDQALIDFFTAVADKSPYPVLLYCAPGFVNSVCISAEAVKKLADHPNIYGIKDTSTTMMEAYMDACGGRDDFQVMAGSLGNFMACLKRGGKGGVLSAANYFPDKCAHFLELYEAGDPGTEEYYAYLKKLAKETGGRASVAGVKCVMNLVGYHGGFPRLPVMPVDKETEKEIQGVIDQIK